MTGKVGEPLATVDEYELNGRDVDERLTLRVSRIRVRPQPDDPYGLYSAGPGNRWVTADLAVRQLGATSTMLLVSQFTAEDASGRAYPASSDHNYPESITPSSNSIQLSAGQRRIGVIAFPVKVGRPITQVRFTDAGFGPSPDTAVWALETPLE